MPDRGVALVNVAAIIVTRGDQNLTPVISSLPADWELVIWDNSREEHDLGVYGRYAAIERTDAELIYVQDDDCVVSDPREIVSRWWTYSHVDSGSHVVCNMPTNFRARHFYDEHSLVGFGACFHRHAPAKAFSRFFKALGATLADPEEIVAALAMAKEFGFMDETSFFRTCDVVFTALTPRVLVDIEYEDMPWASAENRMWKQPWHQESRNQMLELVLKVRDGQA